MIQSVGSGERLDRKEIKKLQKLIRSRRVDLVIAEDIGRIMRRVHAHILCELCEDHETRLVAINDHIDTATDSWRLHSLFASFRHENYNKDTGDRIRRTQRNRFVENGDIKQAILGYTKPEGVKSDVGVQIAPWAKDMYDQWFSLLEEGASYCEVADWLTEWLAERGIPLPPTVRSGTVNGAYIRNTTFNPVLKGVREHNRRMSKRVNATGRPKQIKAPSDKLLQRPCPHLAVVDAARYELLIAKLTEDNAESGRKDTGPRPSKKDSRWPGRHIYCGICGRKYLWGGNGQKYYMICDGVRRYQCWNSISLNGKVAAEVLSKIIFDEIAGLPDFEWSINDLVREELNSQRGERADRLSVIDATIERLVREINNVTAAIASVGISDALATKLAALKTSGRPSSSNVWNCKPTRFRSRRELMPN